MPLWPLSAFSSPFGSMRKSFPFLSFGARPPHRNEKKRHGVTSSRPRFLSVGGAPVSRHSAVWPIFMGNIVSINLPCCSERKPGRPELDPEWKATVRPPVSPNARGFWNGFGETTSRAKGTTWALDGLPPKEIENARSLAAEILSYAKRGQCDRIETLLDAEGLSFVETRLLLSATDLANGDTALMLATRHGHTSTAYFLIERGADLSARNRDGMTAAQLGEQEAERRSALPPEPPSRASWHERVAMPARIRPTRSLSVPQGARATMSELTTVPEDQRPRRGAREHAREHAHHGVQSESQPGSEPRSENSSEPSRAPNGSQAPFWISKERPGSASSSRSSRCNLP